MKSIQYFLAKYLFYILLFIFCISVPFALGISSAFYGILGSFCLFLLIKEIYYWGFITFFSLVWITLIFVSPQVLIFGTPSSAMFASVFETDLRESFEFSKSIPLYAYSYSLCYFILGLGILLLSKKESLFPKKHFFWNFCLFCISFILYTGNTIKHYFFYKQFDLNHSKVAVISFYTNVFSNLQEYRQQKNEAIKLLQQKSTWKIDKIAPKYQNYVLIIGESASRDYMQVYGFEQNNTPFLAQCKGKILEGFTAVAAHTIPALTQTFIQHKNNTPVFQNNIISLAKKAGFETFWISNQGFSGKFDSASSRIGSLTDTPYFLKSFGSESSNYHDFELIPIFENFFKQTNKQTNKPRLFVLHLMGSHTFFKDRLKSPIHYNFINEDISAYLQTLEETDEFLKRIFNFLNKNSNSFSMLYFSDHALESSNANNKFFATLRHASANPKRSAFRVPFVMLSSDDTHQEYFKIDKSAHYFINGFANWLGIKEKTLKTYDFFSPENDTLKIFELPKSFLYYSLPDEPTMKNTK